MIIKSINIQNYKSIKDITFDIKLYNGSYTTMLLGINEVGKSNILEAMSFFNVPTEKFSFSFLENQKNENENNYIDIYFTMEVINNDVLLDAFKKFVHNVSLL